MKMQANKNGFLRNFCVAALVSLLAQCVWAVTDIIWNGDFVKIDENGNPVVDEQGNYVANSPKTIGGVTYTLTLNGNKVVYDEDTGLSYLEVTNTAHSALGSIVERSSNTGGGGATVFMKYSGLKATGSEPDTIIANLYQNSKSDTGFANITGLQLADDEATVKGYWADGYWNARNNDESGTSGKIPVGDDIGFLAFSYGGSGTRCFVGDAVGSWTYVYKCGGYGSSTYGIKAVSIGGFYKALGRTSANQGNASFFTASRPATGLKVHALAFHDQAPTTVAGLNNFKFPAVGMPETAFSYKAAVNGGNPTGWCTSWQWNSFTDATTIVGPADFGRVYQVTAGNDNHPGSEITAADKRSVAVYANLDQMTPENDTTAYTLIGIGGSTSGNSSFNIVRVGNEIKVGYIKSGSHAGYSNGINIAGVKGYHLYTMTYDSESGVTLTLDDQVDTQVVDNSDTAKFVPTAGMQVGVPWQGQVYSTGVGCAIAQIVGYDAVLKKADIKSISKNLYPASQSFTTSIEVGGTGKTVILGNMSSTSDVFVGGSNGTVTIPAGVETEIPHFRFLNTATTSDSVTLNVEGKVTMNRESSNANVWADRNAYKGVLFGHYEGTGVYNISGELDASKTFIELCYTAGAQTMNVNGGVVKAKGIHSNNGNGTINLSNNGEIALSTETFIDVPVTVAGGTIKAGETATYAKALTLSSGSLNLEVANGKTLTITGNVTGEGTLVKKGAGVVTLPSTTVAITLVEGTITSASDALSVALSDELVTAGKVLKKTTADTTTTYAAVDPMATNGDNKYATLADALSAANEGDTITLCQNCTESVTIGTGITVDVGTDKTLSGTIDGTGTIKVGALAEGTPRFTFAETWSGTVEIAALEQGGTRTQIMDWGKKDSRIVFKGLSGTAIWVGSNPINATIQLDGAVEINNGSSAASYVLNTVTGVGNLTLASWGGCKNGNPYGLTYTINTLSDYTGTLTAENRSNNTTGAFKLAIGNIVKTTAPAYGEKILSLTRKCTGSNQQLDYDVAQTKVNGESVALVLKNDGIYLASAKIGDTLYATVQEAIDNLGADQTITLIDTAAQLPAGWTTVTKDGVVTIRQKGDVYYVSGYMGTPADPKDAAKFVTANGGATALLDGDKIIIGSTATGNEVWVASDFAGKKFSVTKNFAIHAGANQTSLLDGAVIDVVDGVTLTISQTSTQKVALGSVTINGAVSVTTDISATEINGTCTITLGENASITIGTKGENVTIASGVVTKRVVETEVTGGIKYSLETIQPEPPTPTKDGITPSIPGADTIEIVDAEGTPVEGGSIPLVTGVYTVTGKVGETVVATETLAVVNTKDAEEGSAPDPVTTAVAVPFKGATVASLLNTALLNEGDELRAFVGGSYSAWTLAADKKTWTPVQKARDGADPEAGAPATTELKRGTAVWLTTAGKVVAFGTYDSTADVSEVTKGYNLIGNPKMEPITLEADTVGDILIPVGSTDRYTVIEKDGEKVWQCSMTVSETIDDEVIDSEVISETAPEIEVGGSVWLIIPETNK